MGPRQGATPTATPPPAPAPTTADVVLRAAGGEAVAALVITGNVTPATALAARARLVGACVARVQAAMPRVACSMRNTGRLRAPSLIRTAALEADGLKLAPSEQGGGFRLSQYGPLYTLRPRRNELLLRVALS